MSGFIVISLRDRLNWIVDGIKDCRPHNPAVVTYISTGKIKNVDNDKCTYEYTTYLKHIDEHADRALPRSTECDILRNCFKNQIAQFLKVSENSGEQFNIFFLDNPITDEDFEYSKWMVEELDFLFESKAFTNFQLIRVLFSYYVDKPKDVTKQVSQAVLRQVIDFNLANADGFLTRTLYIDNQNCNGAALCLDEEGHNTMLPRMLCDLMMLLSNKDDSYKAMNAVSSETGVFSVGYSECAYYHDDVFKYYNVAGKKDLTAYMLYGNDESDSLDYEKEPLGLAKRMERLKPKYEFVPFDSDVDSASESIDKEIDDILISFKEDIINIKKEALQEAQLRDVAATDIARQKKLDEINCNEIDTSDSEIKSVEISNVNSSNLAERKGCNFLGRIFPWFRENKAENDVQIKPKVVDLRVADIVITTEQDKVNQEYPDFICRKDIYEQCLLEKSDNNLLLGLNDGVDTDNSFENGKRRYELLEKFVQSGKFKQYLKSKCENSDSVLLDFLKKIKKIEVLKGEQQQYELLKSKVSNLIEELKEQENEEKQFSLTTHCSSVDNIVDLNKLREYYQNDTLIPSVINRWKKRNTNRVIDSLKIDFDEELKWKIFGFYYINWESPFDFIKQIDLESICQQLINKSDPFVYIYNLSPQACNNISYYFYTDNTNWINEIQHGINLRNANKVDGVLSTHICSKICMFQFLQMNQEHIRGLIDCYDRSKF